MRQAFSDPDQWYSGNKKPDAGVVGDRAGHAAVETAGWGGVPLPRRGKNPTAPRLFLTLPDHIPLRRRSASMSCI